MKSFFWSTFTKVFLVVFIPLFLGSFYIYNLQKENAIENLEKFLTLTTKYNKRYIENDLNKVVEKIKEYSSLIEINNIGLKRVIKNIFYYNKIIVKMVLLDRNNKVLCGISKYNIVKIGDYIDADNFKNFEIINWNNQKVLRYCYRFNSNTILTYISLKNVFENLKEIKPFDIFILDNRGKLIFHTNYNFMLLGRDYTSLLNDDISGKNFSLKKIFNPVSSKNEDTFISIEKGEIYPFNVGTEISKNAVFQKLKKIRIYTFEIFFILLILLLLIIYIISKKIASPIKSLSYVAEKISSGDFDSEFPRNIPNIELNILSNSLKAMMENIKNLINEKDMAYADMSVLYKQNKIQRVKLTQLLDTVDDGIYVVDRNYDIKMINKAESELLSKQLVNILGKKCYEVLAGSSEPCSLCPIKKGFYKEYKLNMINLVEAGFRKQCIRKRVNISFFNFGEDEFLIRTHDISEIYDMLNRVEEEKNKLEVTIKSIGDGVIVTDNKGNIDLINNITENITGWSFNECKGKHLTEIFKIIHEDSGETLSNPVDKVFKTGKSVSLENHTVLISRNGTKKIIEDSASPIFDFNGNIIGVVLVFRDVTFKKKFEKEMANIDKLEAVGRLAAGIAHDFNNILTAVYGNISLAKMYIDENNKAFKRLTISERSLDKAKSLTGQLLTFAKGGGGFKKIINVDSLVRDTTKFALAGSNVDYNIKTGKNLFHIKADENQLFQVFQNLILNAREAMKNAGKLEIFIENSISKDIPFLKDGKYVKIVFKDNGEGMDTSTLKRIFEPFFTTKKKGSGLGLAMCHSIITNHDGYILVDSKKGVGTTFTIYLPAYEEKVDN